MEIKIKNLWKKFGEQEVLKGINLNLKGINSLVIIGPSGGGKSTLLRIIAGLEIPEEGEILINGEKIPNSEKELLEYRKKIGVVFQAYNLFPHLTALKNITLPLEKIQNLKTEISEERAIKLLKRFGLDEHRDKYPHQLSGGQQQRVAIVRALALEPKFLIFDEPTSALDPNLTREILEVILELRKENKNMIIVTHEMSFAEDVSDYVIFITDGKIIEEGDSKSVFKNPKTTKLSKFLGKEN